MNVPLTIDDYVRILRRRIRQFGVPAGIVFLIAIVLASTAAPVYRSVATILVEDLTVPERFVGGAISGYASQQIEVVSRRVLTNENVGKIIAKHGLYRDFDPTVSADLVYYSGLFRDNVALSLVSAEIIDPSSRSSFATIAFNLGFQSSDPEVAQAIADELVQLFLEENRRSRMSAAADMYDFLQSEVQSNNEELIEREAALAAFKEEYSGALPEQYRYNVSLAETTSQELSSVGYKIQELEKRRAELSSQLARVSPSSPVGSKTGDVVLSDEDRLKAALSEYRELEAKYRSNHPDVIRLEREIDSLKAILPSVNDPELLRAQLQFEEARLKDLRAKYTDEHPDVKSALVQIKSIERQLSRFDNLEEPTGSGADNPAYIVLSSQLSSISSEINALRAQERRLKEKRDRIDELIRLSPRVEKEYLALERAYRTAQGKYEDVVFRQREAELALEVEQDRKGRRFLLIEPPIVPIEPIGPNRFAFLVLGALVAMTLGVCLVAAAELLDRTVRGPREVSSIVGSSPLVSIPFIENIDDIESHSRQKLLLVGGGLLLALAAAAYIGFVQGLIPL